MIVSGSSSSKVLIPIYVMCNFRSTYDKHILYYAFASGGAYYPHANYKTFFRYVVHDWCVGQVPNSLGGYDRFIERNNK